MMRKKKLSSILSILFIYILTLQLLHSFYLVAVGNNTGELIQFEVKKIKSFDDETNVFISSPSYIGKDTQLSIKIAKDTVCSLFPKKCKGYDFLVKIESNQPELIGPSGGAAFATAFFRELFNLSDKNVAITGTINPGGVIGPVGGLNYKVKAAEQADYIIIPLGQKIYKDPLTNTTYNLTQINPNIKEAGTIFDIASIVWGLKFNFSNNEINVPGWYTKIMKEIAQDLCNKVNEKVSGNLDYYAQASKCFTDLIKLNEEKYSKMGSEELITKKKELNETIAYYEKLFENLFDNIDGLNKLQLYMILYERLNDAKDVLNERVESKEELVKNIAYVDGRVKTIKEWLRFLEVMPKGVSIDKLALAKLCEKDYQQALLSYNYLIGLNPLFASYLEKDWKNLEKSYGKNSILCIMYSKAIKYKVDSFLALLYLDNDMKPYFYNSTKEIAKFYLLRNKEFPIMAYSYYKYSDYLANNEKDYNSAIIYLEESINLATMIYEINGIENLKEINVLKIFEKQDLLGNKTLIVLLLLTSTFLFYFVISKENKLI